MPAPAPPRYAERLNAAPTRGAVRIKLRGTRRFVALTGPASIPVGSTVDATRGQVRLTTVPTRSGAKQSASFSGAIFRVAQSDKASRVTELRLAGPAPSGCKASGNAAASASRRSRALWGRGKGKFRTRGRHGAATVRGTVWGTVDRCDGTMVIVRRGVVGVRDFAQKRTVTVRAGKRYLARPRPAR